MTAIGAIQSLGLKKPFKKGHFHQLFFCPLDERIIKANPSKKRKTVLLSTFLSLLSRLAKKASHETKIGKRRERKCADEFSAVVE